MAQTANGQNRSLPEQAADQISQYIEEKHLAAGDKLPNEFQLAELCGVGRSTIREAIKQLTFAGRLEVVRGSGTYVLEQKEPLAPERKDDPLGLLENGKEHLATAGLQYLDVRMMLEPEIAALAATNATMKDCQTLQTLQHEVENCVKGGKDHLQADMQFHIQIAACTHNPVLHSLMELMVKGIPIFIEVTQNAYAQVTLDHHKQIADAIAAGDSVGARCAMIAHLYSNRMRILENIEKEKKKM